MSDREGVSPEGGAPDRSSVEPVTPIRQWSEAACPRQGRGLPAATRRGGCTARSAEACRVRGRRRPAGRADAASGPGGARVRGAVRHRRAAARCRRASCSSCTDPSSPESPMPTRRTTQRRVYSWIAAIVGVIGAAASLFVGWMLPLSIAAIVFGVLGLRREEEGRTLAFVGIGTGIAGLVFVAVWIGYYAIVFGALPR